MQHFFCEVWTMTSTNGNVILCIENPLYRQYLEEEFATAEVAVTSVAKTDLAQAIAENTAGVLLLQSDTAEYSLIELSSKLKRLFGETLHTLLFSADYRTVDEAGTSVDIFLQYPTPFTQVQEALKGLGNATRCILVIDDSRLVHNHLGPPLQEQGYEVFDAFNGEEGLTKAKEVKPDLIICDIEMPRMNGFEVCAAIRRTAGIADTYIIMSSTLGSAADQQKGFESGVDEYVTKPVVISELLDRIKKVFTSVRTGRENVLILEEDEHIARNIAKSLSTQGFAVRISETIKDALRLLKRINYDLVISNIHLPDGSVIDLFTALKALPHDRQPDVLIMTSRERQADERMVMNAGAAGVISKPFTMDSLLASVERTLADRRARQEKVQLEKYVSKASMRMALEKSILSGTLAAARAYKKHTTVFFSDIANFTTRCETYPPAEVVIQVNTLFAVMTRIIMAHEGDIDKFIGDACMAFWLDDDPMVSAAHAIRATLRMRKEIDVMNKESPVLAQDPIHIRMGLNTGEVILCDLGAADARIDLTMIGDTVNTAARFESACKQYGVHNLFSAFTIEPLLDTFAARLIDRVKVKGKTKPVECYELFDDKGDISPQEGQLIADFSCGMEAYRTGDFAQALAIFQATDRLEKIREEGGLNPSRLYQERCKYLLEHPPQDWDGVWTLTSK
jgi:DNA-binding response OmpR family regulator